MAGEGYRRPRLCRLCECPVIDGGVLLPKIRTQKLSRWWKAHFDTDYERKSPLVCHFCVWDLRFAERHSEEKEPDDQIWWPKCDKQNNLYYNYYTNELMMKPCLVKIEQLGNEHKLLQVYNNLQNGISEQHLNLVDQDATTDPGEFVQCNQQTIRALKCVFCGKVSTTRATHKYHLKTKHGFVVPKVKTGAKPKILTSGKYFCCFCDRHFASYKSQYKHMTTYHRGEAFKCDAIKGCPNYFKTDEDMLNHVQERHISTMSKCVYCNKLIRAHLVSNHMHRYHKGTAIKCEISPIKCDQWFKTDEDRQKHYEESHKSGKFLCPFCGKRFSAAVETLAHLRKHHPKDKIIRCNYTYCAIFVISEEDRLKHVREVHENHDEKFHCVYCDKFVLSNMTSHVRKSHKDVDIIKCNFNERCPTFFKTVEDREKHVREVHLAEKIREAAPCLYCKKVFAEERTMRMHVKLMHPNSVIKCKYPRWGTFFKSQEDLEKHLSLNPKHREICKKDKHFTQLYHCALCVKSYGARTTLLNHMKNAHCINNETCPHCQKPCTRKNHIISDFCKVCNRKFRCLGLLRRHTVKCKPVFPCPVCSKSFKLKCILNYHCKRMHTVPILEWKGLHLKSLGFKCDDCLIYFSSKMVLQAHRKNIHESTACTCDFCKKQFAHKQSLRNHMRTNHMLRVQKGCAMSAI